MPGGIYEPVGPGSGAASSGGSSGLTIGTTTISGAMGAILWDDSGILDEVTIGSGLNFTGGTLSATGGGGSPGGSPGEVQYNFSGSFGGASNFTISSGNPEVSTAGAYLYNSINAVYSIPNASGDNWFLGGAGNTSLTGIRNFCEGPSAGASLTSGTRNMAQGSLVLAACTTGDDNVGLGASALNALVDGRDNMCIGTGTMQFATTGCNFNVALGVDAMGSGALSGATYNIAIGDSCLNSLAGSSGSNVVIGAAAAQSCTSAVNQVIIGWNAAPNLSSVGGPNTIIGYQTGGGLTTGSPNTIIGANIGGLPSTLASTVIIGDGGGGTCFTYYNQGSFNNLQIGNGATYPGPFNSMSIQNIIYGTGNSGTGGTPSTGSIGIGISGPTASLHVMPSSTSKANLRLDPTSAASPTSPNNGDLWYDGTHLYFQNSSGTQIIV